MEKVNSNNLGFDWSKKERGNKTKFRIIFTIGNKKLLLLACTLSDVISMSDTLAALLLLLVPLRHSKADRRMAKDTLALIQDMVVA